MTFQTENLIKLYSEIISAGENTDTDKKCFEIMVKCLHNYGDTISSIELTEFSFYLMRRFPVLGYITGELLKQQFDKEIIELSDLEIKLYVTLSNHHKKNEQRFNI